MKIRFLGGAQTVTGSKFLVQENDTQILVDCGLFQGLKSLRLLNWEPLNFDAKAIDAVVLTHAHLDHGGALPLLGKAGFSGPIYCTRPTAELTKIILLDAAKIQEEEADYANKKKFSKHAPARPLFTTRDAEKIFALLKPVDLHAPFQVKNLKVEFFGAGHILGAASALISGKQRLYFSGDLGRSADPLMWPPEPIPDCDIVIMESTYGDRRHVQRPSKDVLRECIMDVVQDHGVLLIPSFSVGRAQNLIQEIVALKAEKQIPDNVPVYFNSPMGLAASDLYAKYAEFTRLPPGSFAEARGEVHEIQNAQESIALNESNRRPMIIIAASGMLSGGRVLHHFRAFAGSSENTLLLAGFQAAGTRGRDLLEGKKKIKVHGAFRDVQCKVVYADCFSAHADQNELLHWLSTATEAPKKVFLIHGEPDAMTVLQKKIQDDLKLNAIIPELNQLISCEDLWN